MTPRDAIFAAIGRAADSTGKPRREADIREKIREEAAALLARVPPLRPDRVREDPVSSFVARITGPAIAATAKRVATVAAVPAAVHAYLAEHGLPASIALAPDPKLTALDWTGIETRHAIRVDENVSVCLAPYAIAETGSLVLRSGPGMPVLFAFLPVHHLVVLEAGSVVAWLEDCAAIEAQRPSPRNLLLVTGASGTTDIEGTLVRGAHGPAHLHVILVDPSHPQP